MPAFVEAAIKDIEERLRELQDEVSRLEAARSALTGGRRRPGRPRATQARDTGASARATRARTGRRTSAGRRTRSTGGARKTRAAQVLELVRERPGLTVPELAKAMTIQPNYLYRVLPRLAAEGQVKRDGQGWHPASSPTPARAEPVRNRPTRRRAQAAKPNATPPATRTARTRQTGKSTSANNGRTPRGGTKASVLAALASGDAMTAGQVATKAGLARPTVSTTLSKLAKTGEVQKAERGYRLISAG
jgi:predicted ArsR family transcriptional regulator